MVILTISVMQVAYLGGCAGFILGVLALWLFVEVYKQIQKAMSKPTGAHRLGAQRSGRPDRTVYAIVTAMTAFLDETTVRIRYG